MHLHRAKYQPNGGPDGGDGGRGGNIYLRGNHNYWTLLHLRYERHVFAGHGGNGSKCCSHGSDGEDRYIDVPLGTVAYDAETGKYICDVTEDGQVVMLLKGGRGGLGNWQFRTSTNQTPRYAQPGEPMQEMMVILELKLLADVGLVGFPNAGKSTLLSALSSARPKIANYPFTTLEPSLGIVPYRDNRSFVMADIPGIIEGASEGKGLGLRFLRHIERNSLLLFMVPGDTDNIKGEYEVLLNELSRFNPGMLDKHRVLAITKCDLLDDELIEMLHEDLPADLPVVFISSVTGQGIQELKDKLWEELNSESNKLQAISEGGNMVHRDREAAVLATDFADWQDDSLEEDDADELEEYDIEFWKTMSDSLKPQLLEYALGPALRAFSTTRQGGVSRDNYASFNINAYCGDEADSIQQNKQALCDELGIEPQRLIMPHQTHTACVRVVDEAFFASSAAEQQAALEGIDALITDQARLCIGVSTADCVPVLLADKDQRVVAAIHAGWRGTQAASLPMLWKPCVGRLISVQPTFVPSSDHLFPCRHLKWGRKSTMLSRPPANSPCRRLPAAILQKKAQRNGTLIFGLPISSHWSSVACRWNIFKFQAFAPILSPTASSPPAASASILAVSLRAS